MFFARGSLFALCLLFFVGSSLHAQESPFKNPNLNKVLDVIYGNLSLANESEFRKQLLAYPLFSFDDMRDLARELSERHLAAYKKMKDIADTLKLVRANPEISLVSLNRMLAQADAARSEYERTSTERVVPLLSLLMGTGNPETGFFRYLKICNRYTYFERFFYATLAGAFENAPRTDLYAQISWWKRRALDAYPPSRSIRCELNLTSRPKNPRN